MSNENEIDTSFRVSVNEKHEDYTSKDTAKNEDNAASHYKYSFQEMIGELERETDIQSNEIELNECVEFVSQLVDLFKHNVIIPELQSEDDWHDNISHQIKRNKGITGNNLLDDKVAQIAIRKGLTREQWRSLLYLNLMAGDSLEMTNVTRSHLKKVYDMALRLLDADEWKPVIALIDAIEKYMPENYFTEK